MGKRNYAAVCPAIVDIAGIRYHTVYSLAFFSGRSPETVLGWIRDEKLVPVRRLGRMALFTFSEGEAMIQRAKILDVLFKHGERQNDRSIGQNEA